jgi:3-oxoacyl-[acyl-carrier-protein] synthase-1
MVSALGGTQEAALARLKARIECLRPADFETITRGSIGRVEGIEAHFLPAALRHFDCRNNRLADMALAGDGFAGAVADAASRYGAERIAVVLGTSTSGIQSCEHAYRHRDPETGALPSFFDYANTHDLYSLARFVRARLALRGPALVVSTACSSAARSFIEAAHFIAAGVCDAAIVGGTDTLCRMTLNGFASLDLISATACRPCDAARDGISIGEAAAFLLLEREPPRSARHGLSLLGYGASSDAYHMSSPDPLGSGAVSAMRQALARAGLAPDGIDYINLHGTGTAANDAMEDRAVMAVFGGATPCSSTKGWTGHTLGTSGAVEAIIATLCIRHGFIPGCLGVTSVDPGFGANVLVDNQYRPVRRVLSNSFGFGGSNASLVIGERA